MCNHRSPLQIDYLNTLGKQAHTYDMKCIYIVLK